jgi:hypothetical protein
VCERASAAASTSSESTRNCDRRRCLGRAHAVRKLREAAIQRIGFGEVELTNYSRFGTRDDYAVSVRCIQEKGLVLFLASGRDRPPHCRLSQDSGARVAADRRERNDPISANGARGISRRTRRDGADTARRFQSSRPHQSLILPGR